ncbi:hypothetical protein AAEX28_12330 [Lentisphaerota bacterium WC36G]|nr:hypothetical protein LJT99_15160 [Lentisphaerae bacterium WC36]
MKTPKFLNENIRPKVVKLVSRLIKPFTEEGVISVAEEQCVLANLKHLATKGSLLPAVTPKLIDQKEAAEMLGLGHSNFKKLEKENAFPFKRKMVGSAVRYRKTDLINYILTLDEDGQT